MCMGALGKVMNPIGAIAPKRGFGQWLDPAGAVGRKVGGKYEGLLNPTGVMRGEVRDKKRDRQLQQYQSELAAREKANAIQ